MLLSFRRYQWPAVVSSPIYRTRINSVTATNLLELMAQLNREDGVTFLFSTHDPLVMEAAQRVVRLRDGRVVDDDRKAQACA